MTKKIVLGDPIIINGRKVTIIKRKKITFTPRTLFGILLNIA